MTWAIEACTRASPTDFYFPIALDFVENEPILYLSSGYYTAVANSSQIGPDELLYSTYNT